MLTLSRFPGQSIIIGDDLLVRYVKPLPDGHALVRFSLGGRHLDLPMRPRQEYEAIPGVIVAYGGRSRPARKALLSIDAPRRLRVDRLEVRERACPA